jgi:hypothetical protein
MVSPIRLASTLVTFTVLALGVSVSAPVGAQVIGATLSGTVTDASGAIVPQAKIFSKNLRTGIGTSATANSDGFYTAPNLLPGAYEVSASAPGFATEVQTGITLTVGAQQVLDFSLKVGQVTEKILVSGAAPTVQLASSTIGGMVGSDSVVELPLNGRDWTMLAALEPGVDALTTQRPIGASTSKRGNRGYGSQLTVSGTRPQLNNYRLDGISIVDHLGGSPGSILGLSLGVDAVGEFSVLTANYTAEYGRTTGGVINAITRSGTNQIHGSAYEFLRNNDLDARQFFDTTTPPFRRNQFGASVGGPIQKQKTFFFANYEGLRQFEGTTVVNLVPSQGARNGILHNANGTACTIGVVSPGCALTNSAGTVGVDPLVKPYLGFYPLPNAGLVGNGDTGNFDIATNAISTEDFATVRIDRKISEKDSVSGTWLYDSSVSDLPDPLDNLLLGNKSNRQVIALQETHIFNSSLVNTLRGGYSRLTVNSGENIQAINPLVNDVSLGTFAGLPAPGINVAGLASMTGGGIGPFTGDAVAWNSFQAYDDAFLTKGVHSIKFGFAFERMQTNSATPSDPTGLFAFGSLADFLTNEPLSFEGQVPGKFSSRGLRQSLFGGYLQDDWRVRPNLTLNLGLRYEAVTVPTEVHNFEVNLETLTSPPPGHLGPPYINTNPSLRDFEPRVGFAWDPFHDGKTAVRGAFGIFDALPLSYEFWQVDTFAAPFVQVLTTRTLLPGSFPTGAVANAGQAPVSELKTDYIEPNPPRNYVMIWNLNVQRQLTPSTTVTVGYVGNHGVHMLDRDDDFNMVLPQATASGYLWPTPAGSGTRLNPAVGAIAGLQWAGSSLYDALEVGVVKRISHGLQVQGSYTWGKSIDTGSASAISDPYTNSISSLLFFCSSCRRGLSDFNIAHSFSANYIWDVPNPKNWGAIGSHVLGGWELGGIITAETGVPFTPLIVGDPLGQNSTDPFDYPDRLTGPGCGSAVNPGNVTNYIKLSCFGLPMATSAIAAECTPFGFPAAPIAGTCANLVGNARRNSIIGPGLATWDFSLFKNNYITKISENFNVQFRVEAFNILNRANFGTPDDRNKLFNASGNPIGGAGALDSLATPAREIQFGLKLIW